MEDYIVRATAANAQIRAFAASTTELVEQARQRHNTSPVASAALGRLLTGGVMMGSMMKNPTDILTLQVKCGGPIGGLTVTADSQGKVKGYVNNPDVLLPPKNGKLDVGGALGAGFLNVIKDMGLKEPYSGQTVLQTGEIAEDLTYYFATSEQVPSSVGLGVLMEKDNTVKCAGGFIVQVMPFIEDEVLEEKVIKAILQPLVENSTRHGFRDKAGECCIAIQAKRRGCGLILEVMDNGNGMSEEQLCQLNRDIEKIKENPDNRLAESKHIGVKNVFQRLYLEYRENLEFKISSRIGFGVKIEIVIKDPDRGEDAGV